MKTNIMKTSITLIALAGAFCLTTGAFAQDIGARITAVQGTLGTVRATYLDAQIDIGKALGIKEDVLKKASEAQALASSTKEKDAKAAIAQSANLTTAIADKIKEGGDMSADAKAQFASGASKFGSGLVAQAGQIAIVKSIVDSGNAQMSKANALQKAKLAKALSPATSLASSLPGDVKEAGKTGKMILDMLVYNKNITEHTDDK